MAEIKNCIVTLQVYTTSGETKVFTLEVPKGDDAPFDLDYLAEQLYNKYPEEYSEFSNAIDISVISNQKPRAWKREDVQKGTLGNYSLSQAINLIESSNVKNDIKTYMQKLENLGYKDFDTQNLLLVDSSYDACGFYDDLAVIRVSPSGSSGLIQYLRYLCIKNTLFNQESDPAKEESRIKQLDAFIKLINKLPELSNKYLSFKDNSKLNELIQDILEDQQKSGISEKTLLKFLDLYYLDSNVRRLIHKSNDINVVLDLLNEESLYLNPFDLEQQTDEDVKEFISLFNDKNGHTKEKLELSIEDLSKFPLFQVNDNNIQKTVHYINNHMEGQHFFDIDYITDSTIVFKSVTQKPLLETESVNTYYFGKHVQPIISLGNWHLVKINDLYYVTSYIPAGISTKEDITNLRNQLINLQGIKFKNETASYDVALRNLYDASLRSYPNQNNPALSIYEVKTSIKDQEELEENSKSKIKQIKIAGKPDVFRFVGRGIIFESKTLGRQYDIKKTNAELRKILTNPDFKDQSTKYLWSFLYKGNKAKTYAKQLRSILQTDEDLLVFLKLHEQFSKSIIKSKEAEITVQGQIMDKVIEYIMKHPLKVFEAIKVQDTNDTYTVKIVKTTKDDITGDTIPLYTTVSKPLRLEMMSLINTLKSRFGLNIEMINNLDLRDSDGKFVRAGIFHNAKAFILDGKVYINVDKANTESVLHEFGHLILQKIKVTKPELYYKFLDIIESFRQNPNQYLLEELKKFENSRRARTDINEELFVALFADIVTGKFRQEYKKKLSQDINTNDVVQLISAYKSATESLFRIDPKDETVKASSITSLLKATLRQIKEMGAEELDSDVKISISGPNHLNTKDMKQSRKISNLIEQLLSPDFNGNSLIKEECL